MKPFTHPLQSISDLIRRPLFKDPRKTIFPFKQLPLELRLVNYAYSVELGEIRQQADGTLPSLVRALMVDHDLCGEIWREYNTVNADVWIYCETRPSLYLQMKARSKGNIALVAISSAAQISPMDNPYVHLNGLVEKRCEPWGGSLYYPTPQNVRYLRLIVDAKSGREQECIKTISYPNVDILMVDGAICLGDLAALDQIHFLHRVLISPKVTGNALLPRCSKMEVRLPNQLCCSLNDVFVTDRDLAPPDVSYCHEVVSRGSDLASLQGLGWHTCLMSPHSPQRGFSRCAAPFCSRYWAWRRRSPLKLLRVDEKTGTIVWEFGNPKLDTKEQNH